jgi:hypothetical protein
LLETSPESGGDVWIASQITPHKSKKQEESVFWHTSPPYQKLMALAASEKSNQGNDDDITLCHIRIYNVFMTYKAAKQGWISPRTNSAILLISLGRIRNPKYVNRPCY